MTDGPKPGIRMYAGSIGLLVDRSASTEEVLGTCWLIEENMVATCAHFIAPFEKGCLDGIRIRFPVSGQERSVSRALFHPRFNHKQNSRLSRQTMTDSAMPAMPIQAHNAVVLLLKPLNEISVSERSRINQKLTLPAATMEQGMGGSLSEIDLALVVQTITNARKEGMLVVSDERNRPVARIFCQSGRVMHAIYKNLVNEMAIYQIIARNVTGNFFFQSTLEPDWPVRKPIMRPTDMLLIESHRRLDELDKLSTSLGGAEAHYMKAIPELNTKILPPEVQDYVKALWPYIDGATPLGQLWQLCNLDDYAVYATMHELFKTRQIENVREAGAYLTQEMSISKELGMDFEPIPIALEEPLHPMDEIENLTVDFSSGRARVRLGSLLGTLRPGDPFHLVHNVKLLPEAAGSPLFKHGMVIGMHCGNLPYEPESGGGPETNLQQMLWVESIIECLKDSDKNDAVRRISHTSEEVLKRLSVPDIQPVQTVSDSRTKNVNKLTAAPAAEPAQESVASQTITSSRLPGCREVARVHCPKCGSTSLESSRFCKLCGQRLMQDLDVQPKKPVMPLMLALVSLVVVCILGANASWMHIKPRQDSASAATTANSEAITLPEVPWVKASVFGAKQGDPKAEWTAQDPAATLKNNVMIYLKMRVSDPSFVYLLYRGSSEKSAHLIYPDDKVKDVRMENGQEFTIPSTTEGKDQNGQRALNGFGFSGPPGTETIVILASRVQLPDLQDPVKADGIFQKALTILGQAGQPAGIELDGNVLQDGLIPANPKKMESQATAVFLRRLKINHSE